MMQMLPSLVCTGLSGTRSISSNIEEDIITTSLLFNTDKRNDYTTYSAGETGRLKNIGMYVLLTLYKLILMHVL